MDSKDKFRRIAKFKLYLDGIAESDSRNKPETWDKARNYFSTLFDEEIRLGTIEIKRREHVRKTVEKIVGKIGSFSGKAQPKLDQDTIQRELMEVRV